MIGVFSNLRRFSEFSRIREYVERWERLGIDGVVCGDHIFRPNARRPTAEAHAGMDQLTMLTVVATLSTRLRVGAMVANSAFQHPVLLVRRFAQLAALYGGDRVYAGFGAGWARREFDALGIPMPPHPQRMARFAETLAIARGLYDDGFVDIEGGVPVTARALPLAPRPKVPPRLLVAGGSPQLIALAAKYADHLDLNAPPHRITKIEPQGRLQTTIGDLEASVSQLECELASVRRDAVGRSVVIDALAICKDSEAEAKTARFCANVGLEPQSLGRCPFALIGEPRQIADKLAELRERLGLSWVAIPFDIVDRFCAEVAPLLT